jgi:Putative restriction endonuclease
MQEANEPSVAYLTAAEHAAMDVVIPEALIYEMVNGKPIYYRGWREVLKNEKTIEQVMASSLLQGYLVGEIFANLHAKMRKQFILTTNETGLKFDKGDWRAADIALFPKGVLASLYNKYANEKPSIVIEIDTKADAENISTYYRDKTKHLLQNGIQKVIWVFTETQQIMIAEPNKHWEIFDWSETVEVAEGIGFNVAELIADFEGNG